MSDIIYHTSHKYINWYISLIRKAQNRTSIDGYFEKHHIFPKSIFGKNDLVVKLTAREHFIAHKLLYKIYLLRYGSDHKFTFFMMKAFGYMMTREEIKFNSRMYNQCKQAMSISMKGNNNPSVKYGISDEHREKISLKLKGNKHPMFGKKHTEESIHKIKEARKKQIMPPCSEETKNKISIANKGKPFTEKQRLSVIESNKRRTGTKYNKNKNK